MTQQADLAAAAAPQPPQNLDAEESLLGGLLLAGAGPLIDRVSTTGLQPGDFYRLTHGQIYHAALQLHTAGQPYDAITVAAELERLGRLDHVGGKERIHELAALVPAAANAPHYAQLVVDAAQRRRLAHVAEHVIRTALAGEGTADQLLTDTRAALDDVGERSTGGAHLNPETWHEFESQAHDHVPMLVDKIWPEAAFGFIAAPPKKGKTWVGLAFAVAVATGQPLFGRYHTAARPVLFVALEGHRAALRARVGAIARGHNIDPDGDGLANLHFLYKPPGINLADPVWARRLHRAANAIDAALIIVDVLRAGARIKENDQADFSNLRANLQPISNAGRALALLHHNVKLSEISRERDPGERMSGSGAMFGALDAAIYITGSENHAARLRLEFDLRDEATLDPINVHLTGEATSPSGGYSYLDTLTLQIVADAVGADDLRAPAAEIYTFISANGGSATGPEICAYFADGERLLDSATLTARIHSLERLGVTIERRRGSKGNLFRIAEPAPLPNQQWTLDQQYKPHNQAAEPFNAEPLPNDPFGNAESGDLQAYPINGYADPPTGETAPPTADGTPDPATTSRGQAAHWVETNGWTHNDLPDQLLHRYPNLGAHDISALLDRAAEIEAAELATLEKKGAP